MPAQALVLLDVLKGERIQMRVQSIGAYYTLQGAAEALGVSYWQVARVVRQRQTPTLLLGQTQLVKLDDLRGLFAAAAAEAGASAQQEVSAPSAAASYRARGISARSAAATRWPTKRAARSATPAAIRPAEAYSFAHSVGRPGGATLWLRFGFWPVRQQPPDEG